MKKPAYWLAMASASLIFIFPQNILAASLFDLRVESEGSVFQESYNAVEDLTDGIDEDYIRQRISGYTDQSEANVQANFRGLPILMAFQQNSTQLTLNIPAIGVQEVFTGATRDDSVDALENWFKKDGGDALTRLMQALISSTPNDPIAGNPNSLMAHMVHSDYERGFTADASGIQQAVDAQAGNSETNANLVGLGARFGSYRQGDLDSQHMTLPLSYTIRFDDSPNQLNLKMPLVLTEVDGAKAYNSGLGADFEWQVTDRWKITPSANYAVVASADLGSIGQIISGSVTSAYQFNVGKSKLHVGNMLGHYKTLKFSGGGYSFDPDISNTVIRNGFMWAIPTPEIMQRSTLELFVTDTRYFGSDLYIDQYNEIGFSFGFSKTERKTLASKIKNYLSDFRMGFTYLHSDNSKGFSVNLGYRF